jgi:hypothetical protein
MTWVPKPDIPHNCYALLPQSELYKTATHDWQCECGKTYTWFKQWDHREGDCSYWKLLK